MRISIEALRQFAPLVDHLKWHGIDIADVECFEALYEPTPQTLMPEGMSIFETFIAGVEVRLKNGGSAPLPLPHELIAKIVGQRNK